MSLIVDEHRQYLADEVRIAAYRRAVHELVKPGDVVLDLGAGTGIMSLLACEAGARRVYAVDEGAIVQLAREICSANGFAERIVFLKELSTRAQLPEKVDAIVADQIGRFGFEAGLLQYFSDARQRFLKPGGVSIPSRLDLWIAPIEFAAMFNQVEFWNQNPAGFDFRPARTIAANTGYPVKLEADHLLGGAACLASIDLATADTRPLSVAAEVETRRAGTLHGIGGWFSAQLAPSVTMTNAPLAKESINRRSVFFPIDQPVAVRAGDRIRVEMHIVPTESQVSWKVDFVGDQAGGALRNPETVRPSFRHSTFRGMLICREDLRRTMPTFVPRLSAWGDARKTVLVLCDGSRSLAEIEREVYERHSTLFRSPDQAATFVAEVVTRYSV